MPSPVFSAAATVPPADTLLTCREAAEYLRKAPRTLRMYVQHGRLRAWRVGGSLRFDRADLDALVVADRRTVAQAAQ